MDTGDRTILRRLILALTMVLLIGVVVWVFFIRDSGKKPVSSNGNTGTSQGANNGAQSDTNKPAAGSPQAQGDTKPGTTAGASTQQPDTLAKTGPGNLVAVFAGATTIGGLAHHLHNRKRR